MFSKKIRKTKKEMASVGKFIPNTNKRYSITEEGIVFSNYRYSNNGKKFFQRKEIRRYFNNQKNKTLVVNLQFGKYSPNNRMTTVYLNTLMEKCFKLKKPDKYHFYDLRFKDGDCFNSSLKNLEYKIRVNADAQYNFYPQPFYDLKGKITHKRCARCGNKKQIEFFHLQKPKKKGQNKTYRNSCEPCRAKKQWEWIKADEERLKNRYTMQTKWANSKEGRLYYEKFRKDRYAYDKKNITPHYIASGLKLYKDGISAKELTPEMIKIATKAILLRRKINQINNN